MDNKTILEVYGFQRGYLSMLVDDIPDAQMTSQPKGAINHPAWQLGHLAIAADGACEVLGGTPRLDKAWGEKFGRGSIPRADRAGYPSKADLIGTLDERRGRLASLLAEATDALLKQPNPVAMLAPMLPTRGHMALFMMVFHEATHMGQLACWRKSAGMVEALSKFGA